MRRQALLKLDCTAESHFKEFIESFALYFMLPPMRKNPTFLKESKIT